MLKTRYGILFVTVLFVVTIFCGVSSAERVIRFAHFTDIHITQDNNAPQGLTQAAEADAGYGG